MREEDIKTTNINFLLDKSCDTCVWHYFIEDYKDESILHKYCRFKSPRKMSVPNEEVDTYYKCPTDNTCQFWKDGNEFLYHYNKWICSINNTGMAYHYKFVEQFDIVTIIKKMREFGL